MLSPFSFVTASHILFGRGQAVQAVAWLARRVKRVLLVYGVNRQRTDWLEEALHAAGVQVRRFSVPGEPTIELIIQALDEARQLQVQAVVSLGGGSVIDAGKAIAALVPAKGNPLDYLEVVGTGQVLKHDPLPFVALPTTAGTGAEVTKNAVISVPEHQRKVSLRDERMLADLAIIDADLMDNTPQTVTLFSGLDAITQVIEPYLCSRANPLTDALCRDAIPIGLQALRQLMQQECAASRDEMAWVSLCGGLALANAGLGVIHGLAGPLGGLCHVPHGAICGALLPFGLTFNRRYITQPHAMQRMEQVLAYLAQAFQATPDTACDALRQWSGDLGLGSLRQLGVPSDVLALAARAACESSSMKANPVVLSQEQLLDLLQQAWD